MTFFRPLTAFLLLLSVALASVTMASGRGQGAGGTEMVICTGTTIKVVMIGPDGAPVEETRVCPDYGLALFAGDGIDAASLPARPMAFDAVPATRCVGVAVPTDAAPHPPARAPPVPV